MLFRSRHVKRRKSQLFSLPALVLGKFAEGLSLRLRIKRDRMTTETFAVAEKNLPKLLQAKIIQTLENALSPSAVARTSEGTAADRQLLIDIRSFELQAGNPPVGRIELAARVTTEGSRVIASRTFSASAPAFSDEVTSAAAALNDAFVRVATDMANWVRNLPNDTP